MELRGEKFFRYLLLKGFDSFVLKITRISIPFSFFMLRDRVYYRKKKRRDKSSAVNRRALFIFHIANDKQIKATYCQKQETMHNSITTSDDD